MKTNVATRGTAGLVAEAKLMDARLPIGERGLSSSRTKATSTDHRDRLLAWFAWMVKPIAFFANPGILPGDQMFLIRAQVPRQFHLCQGRHRSVKF